MPPSLRSALVDSLLTVVGAATAVVVSGAAAIGVAWWIVPAMAILRPAIGLVAGVYRRVWRFSTISDLRLLAGVVLAGSALLAVIGTGLAVSGALSTAQAVTAVAVEGSLAATLLGYRRFSESLRRRRIDLASTAVLSRPPRRVLVYGAGELGALVAREALDNLLLGLAPVGFVDDDPAKLGQVIHGLKVVGRWDDIPTLVTDLSADEVIVAQARISAGRFQEVRETCATLGIPVRSLPGLPEILDETVTFSRTRPIRIEDLLGREPQPIPDEPLREFAKEKVVLVTGAGGSIGSELSRQVATLGARRVILLDRAETPLFFIEEEMRRTNPALAVRAVLGDVANQRLIREVMAAELPDIVLHAAANKHVPLSETNVAETVLTNVRGTRVVAEAAAAAGAGVFIFISTDKAVDPKSVMGSTKKIGESLVREIGHGTGGRFIVVRFGNVLGSQGSVVPLFREQIARGGPITVTHPEMTRFFMTIPEAVRLILFAGAVGQPGDVHVLNMGNPIRIEDLAREMIRLSDPTGTSDIQIEYSGLRPGEKMEEELFAADEEPAATGWDFLLLARSGSRDPNVVARARVLEELAERRLEHELREQLLGSAGS